MEGYQLLPILQVISILKQQIYPNVKTVLDLGCGSFHNRTMDLFYEHDILLNVFNGKQITGIDIFEKDILWRKEHGPIGNYICINILDYDIKEYYDVIICHHVLEHLTQKEHDIILERIEKANCRYIILGGPVGYSDNSVFVEIKNNEYEEHKIGLDPEFYENSGYNIFLFAKTGSTCDPSFLAIKERQ